MPQSTTTKTGTGTGTDIGTLSVTAKHENPGVKLQEDLHFEDDNRLKLALRKGSIGRVSHFYISLFLFYPPYCHCITYAHQIYDIS